MAHITQAEFARTRGVSRQAISKMVAEGRLDGALSSDGKIDPDAALSILGPSAKQSDAEWRKWRAKREKLKYETEVQNLRHVDDITRSMERVGEVTVMEIDFLPTHAEALCEAAGGTNVKAVQSLCKKISRGQRAAIAANLRMLGEDEDPDAEPADANE